MHRYLTIFFLYFQVIFVNFLINGKFPGMI